MLRLFLIISFNIIFAPLYLLFFVLCFLATFLPLFPTITTRNNARNRLGYTGIKNHFFVACVFQNYVYYLFEIVLFDLFFITRSKTRKNFDLQSVLNEFKLLYPESPMNSFTFLAGHVGNLESQLIPATVENKRLKTGKLLYALAKPARFKILTAFLDWHRLRQGYHVIWTDKNIFTNMDEVLEKGHSMLLFIDQKPKKNGVFIRFFGEYSCFPTSGVKFCTGKKSIYI